MRKIMVVVLVLLASMSACMNQGNEEPGDKKPSETLPSPTTEKKAVQEQTPTGTKTATQEQIPTATSTPEEEDIPTPDQKEVRILSDGVGMESPGPWFVFKTEKGFILVSQDGSEIGMIPLPLDYFVYVWEEAPQGGMVAFIKDTNVEKVLEVRSIQENEGRSLWRCLWSERVRQRASCLRPTLSPPSNEG